ncbi:hypothetical protein MCAG_01353 [Micromonospora sp. ATCC 39149]|uniref:Uncharacterized protein n=1 Tax=Micromonospora carbonacea TaxID=47853 RepID=A0A7D5YBT3_9ACTN|nr:hypothetical protein [Micromonospora sp. ATCC 39149]EEP71026.1 hypothetical protein MCAG_01353 [Micromonospora sp. ATCC 39149]QLJ97353.1 hypothetical protein HZU44_21320 [Micromonospora carbonacea]
MQRRLVAGSLAPLLVCALLLHIGLACRAPFDAAALNTVAPIGPVGPVATTRPALPTPAAAPTIAIGPIADAESSSTAGPMVTGSTARGSTVTLRASVTDGPDPAAQGRAASRAGRVTLEAYRLVTTLAARTGQSPDPTVVTRFDGKACGSVTRFGRGNQSTDRRDPGPQASSALPDATVHRDNTADGRPVTADAGPDPIRLSVLRC